ncbi:MAG: peroxide stress protein YaaA [Lentimicrobiaceae bacterium]|nr:peroxide stress protein YaaA [Lentimicrobiaceae bacterium]
MIILLSPAKTLDFETATPVKDTSTPNFIKQANTLQNELAKFNYQDLAKLMTISDNLAQLNEMRYKNWNKAEERQAIYAYKGDVYEGLDAYSLSKKQINFAQKHVVIISGLYGALKPLDLIKPYRLDMSTKLKVDKNNNLYSFWGDKITEYVNLLLKENKSDIVVNLASNEYFKAIDTKKLNAKIVTPIFKDFSNGQYKVISFLAKKARGLMTRYIVENEINKPEDLIGFNDSGYMYKGDISTKDTLYFYRG